MEAGTHIFFPPFHLDLWNAQLWKGDQLLPLPRKHFEVLRCLVEHPGQLVTKEQLQKAVWPDTVMQVDVLLKGYIRDLRKVLDDSAKAPRFIETVRGRGYPVYQSAARRPDATHHSRTNV